MNCHRINWANGEPVPSLWTDSTTVRFGWKAVIRDRTRGVSALGEKDTWTKSAPRFAFMAFIYLHHLDRLEFLCLESPSFASDIQVGSNRCVTFTSGPILNAGIGSPLEKLTRLSKSGTHRDPGIQRTRSFSKLD